MLARQRQAAVLDALVRTACSSDSPDNLLLTMNLAECLSVPSTLAPFMLRLLLLDEIFKHAQQHFF